MLAFIAGVCLYAGGFIIGYFGCMLVSQIRNQKRCAHRCIHVRGHKGEHQG